MKAQQMKETSQGGQKLSIVEAGRTSRQERVYDGSDFVKPKKSIALTKTQALPSLSTQETDTTKELSETEHTK